MSRHGGHGADEGGALPLTSDAAQAREIAAHLADGIRQAAARAQSEEDLRIGVETLLGPALAELGIESSPRYERSYRATGSILRGRSDAVYGRVVIEYERPGALRRQGGVHEAVRQLDQYLRAEAGSREALKRSVGVALDGERIIFVRYLGGGRGNLSTFVPRQTALPLLESESTDPEKEATVFPVVDVAEDSVREFLLYLRALRRRRLTPEALAEEFGPGGDVATAVIGPLAEALRRESHPRIRTLFREWSRIFGIVYGKSFDKEVKDSRLLSDLYGLPRRVRLKRLLFAVHTYYALLMKLLAAELASLQAGAIISSPVAVLPSLPRTALKRELQDLEDGGLFGRLGIRNFLEGDYFGWYLAAWDSPIEEGIRELARRLGEFEPATETLEPESTRDLLKKLYQYLVPRQLRHDLGEFYTPDWLAELMLNEVGYEGDPAVRVLDPACGSGTFLVLAIRRARERAERTLGDPRETAQAILQNIVGFDINPLAVIAARTNYLLALGPLVRYQAPLEIPIYLCDSVVSPFQHRRTQVSLLPDYSLESSVGAFHVPKSVVDGGSLPALVEVLEDAVRHRYGVKDFVDRVERELGPLPDSASLPRLYRRIAQLEREGRNGLWARIIKNGFAPVSNGQFDLVVGNPPWIRWGYLADEYRDATKQMWVDYGLFSLKGMAARLGGGEKDFSMLFTFACADHYLHDKGLLGFVITQEVLKGKGAGEGFRHFQLGPDGVELGVLKAHDLVAVRPFEGAGNKTGAIVLRKGSATSYPVPYVVWNRRPRVGAMDQSMQLEEAMQLTDRVELRAFPLGDDPYGAWQTTDAALGHALPTLQGSCAYKARIGARIEPYGVFWLKLLHVRPDGFLLAENLPELGKTPLEKRQVALEPDLVYPAVRGSDVRRWVASPGVSVIVTQDPINRIGYPERQVKVQWPRTFGYLKSFEDILRSRAAFRKYYEPSDPFYSQFNISTDTFAPARVVWQRMAGDMVAAVLTTSPTMTGERDLLALDTTTFVPVESEDEGHFLCALLNSTVVGAYVRSFSSAGRGFGSPSILDHIAIPKFDSLLSTHAELARLGREAHNLAEQGGGLDLAACEEAVNSAAAALWDLPQDALATIASVLKR